MMVAKMSSSMQQWSGVSGSSDRAAFTTCVLVPLGHPRMPDYTTFICCVTMMNYNSVL
jgi:hypothetical protein